MVYQSKKAVLAKEMLAIFEKNPVVTLKFVKRLVAEMEIQYGTSNKTANDLVTAFVETGRVKIEG